jgi:Sugar phosphate permease
MHFMFPVQCNKLDRRTALASYSQTMHTQPKLPFTQEQKALTAMLFLMTVLNYLDRNALSVVAPVMRKDLGLSTMQYAYALNAFLAAYAVMYAGSGVVLDRIGYRAGLMLFVGAWSIAAGLHAFTAGLLSLVAFRFLLGLAEPGGFTGAVKTVSARFSAPQRALACGLFTAGAGVGALVSPPLIVYLSVHYGWRKAFLVPAVIGLLWVPLWAAITRARAAGPADEPEAIPLRFRDIADRRLVAYILVRFFGDSSGYFFNFWVPEYLVTGKHFTFAMVGALAWIPPCFSDLGSISGGYISGRLVERGYSAVWCRKAMMTCAALLVICGTLLQAGTEVWVVLLSLSISTFGVGVWAANMHALATDAFPKPVVARVHGIAGSAGAIGGVLVNTAVGYLAGAREYVAVFALVACLQPLGVTALWLWLRDRRR